MTSMLDAQPLSLPCPNCGHLIDKTVSWFRGHDKLTCSHCHFIACLDTRRLKQALMKVDAEMDNFMTEFQRLANQ
jgi:hypothetical protein